MGQECLGRDAVVEAAGTGGNVWTLSGRSLRSGCWFPQNFCGSIHSDTRVTNKASAKISHGTLSSETLNT